MIDQNSPPSISLPTTHLLTLTASPTKDSLLLQRVHYHYHYHYQENRLERDIMKRR